MSGRLGKVSPLARLRRTPIGFDRTDHVLDAVIEPAIDSWAWKDEEEESEATALGLFTPCEADGIRMRAFVERHPPVSHC